MSHLRKWLDSLRDMIDIHRNFPYCSASNGLNKFFKHSYIGTYTTYTMDISFWFDQKWLYINSWISSSSIFWIIFEIEPKSKLDIKHRFHWYYLYFIDAIFFVFKCRVYMLFFYAVNNEEDAPRTIKNHKHHLQRWKFYSF